MRELHRDTVRAEYPLIPVQAGFDVTHGYGEVADSRDAGCGVVTHPGSFLGANTGDVLAVDVVAFETYLDGKPDMDRIRLAVNDV